MDILDRLDLPLSRTEDDPRPVVLMTCGIAGSGKSTLTKAIVARHPSFTRLSVDNIIHTKHGIYNVDYPPDKYDEYLEEASVEYEKRLTDLLEAGERDIAFDRSLYSRQDREYFKKLIEERGGRWVLVFFRPVSKEIIWNRIQRRRLAGVNADSALDITPELLTRYWDGFENPNGEGEFVVDVVD